MIRAAEAGEVLDLSRRGNNVLRAAAIRDLLVTGDIAPSGLRLIGARIIGVLNLDDITCQVPVAFRKCVLTAPAVARRARIPLLCLDSSHLEGLDATGLHTDNLLMRDTRCTGTVGLSYANVATVCDLSETSLQTGDRPSLQAPGLRVGKDLSLAGVLAESTASPAIDLSKSEIGGEVLLAHAVVVSGEATAITLRRAAVGDSVTLIETCTRGAVDLDGVEIGKNLTLRKSTVVGSFWLEDAKIGLNVLIYGSQLRNARGVALKADRVHVGGSFHIRAGTEMVGAATIRSTTISSQLSISDVTIEVDAGDALCLARTKVVRSLEMSFKSLIRNKNFSVHVEGLTYPDPPIGEGDWLELLDIHSNIYQPQAYQQLAAVHRAAGHETYSREVLIAQQRDLRHRGDPGNRVWHWFLGVTLGYGYQPSRAVAGLVVTFLLAIGLVWTAGEFGGLTPAKDRPADACSPVNRISLAADLAIPLVKLGGTPRCELANGPAGQWATGAGWVVQILGWSFATLSVAGFTGLVRKD